MTFSTELTEKISPLHLLRHPFYQAWMEGQLTREDLNRYSMQYAPHVKAFPRFVSAIHSQCENEKGRKLLLENLNDEEGTGGLKSHPELWRDFAAAFGADVDSLREGDIAPKSRELVETFFRFCRSSYEEGLGALYAYEHQVPAIAVAKIDGLKRFYGITESSAHAFFEVHQSADVHHSATCRELLDQLTPDQKQRAMRAAVEASQALWDFLTEVHGREHCAS
jgi:pyrroloquinoline-quinone synthase